MLWRGSQEPRETRLKEAGTERRESASRSLADLRVGFGERVPLTMISVTSSTNRRAELAHAFHLVQNRTDSLRLHVYCASPSDVETAITTGVTRAAKQRHNRKPPGIAGRFLLFMIAPDYWPLPNRRDHHPARRGAPCSSAGCGSGAGAGSGAATGIAASADGVGEKLTFSRTVERRGACLSVSGAGVVATGSTAGSCCATGCGSTDTATGSDSGWEAGAIPSKSATAVAASGCGGGESSSEIEPASPSSPPRRRRPPRRPRRRGRRSPPPC
jgi:hypothetical protein